VSNQLKAKARALAVQMTLEEKTSLMVHKSPAVPRLGIPAYNWWNEALHGVARAGTATVFPQSIALAAAFSPALVKRVADAISTEARAKYHAQESEGDRDIYKGLTFWSPNINIFRDPRWGRGHETFGEDPYLTGLLGMAFIKGLQGECRDSLKTAACAKHFAVHSGPENDRHKFNAVVGAYDLWNTYLSAFEDAVKAGVEAVMGAYNRTLGEPCCGSELLLKKILRGKWGFDGHVVSDCWAIKDFHENHRVTQSPAESVALAVKNGCDINCGILFPLAYDAVKAGMLDETRIDEAVTRLLTTRMRLGLLGAPANTAWTNIPYSAVDCAEHAALNLEAAEKSIVLLRNDGVLPFACDNALTAANGAVIKTLSVIGPNADSRAALEGNYSGRASHYSTPLEGIRALAEPAGVRVLYSEGCHLYKDRISPLAEPDDRFAEARIAVKNSDAVVLCLGLDAGIEGEEGDAYAGPDAGGDRNHIELPGRQQALADTVFEAAGNKPVIVISISGGALVVNIPRKPAALIQAFYPGAAGGLALARILFGKVSPSGKLPVTFYRSTACLPDFTDYCMTNRTYRYFKDEPLYPFGFGLGYSRFQLLDLNFDGTGASSYSCSVTIINTGAMKARETAQIYTTLIGQKERWCLCGIAEAELDAGAQARLTIKLGKSAFARYDDDGNICTVLGAHTLYAGFTQPDAYSAKLYGQKPLSMTVRISE
jgi:beta-glucosidase